MIRQLLECFQGESGFSNWFEKVATALRVSLTLSYRVGFGEDAAAEATCS
jgi:hypothetical protein